MEKSLYTQARDTTGNGSWWQLATPNGFCYLLRHEDGNFHCICSEHTAENPCLFSNAKAMEAHLSGKNGKEPQWPYKGPEPIIPYTVSTPNLLIIWQSTNLRINI